ncbi:MAG: hypothetical protein PWQ11_617 [Candidatus Diapherotrites archaeon]|nr:hypothetical protein [Candidatus Diapherotrites archaeon]
MLAEKDKMKIIIECKQYERSHITIRNLIHQWYGKNQIMGADAVIIAIYGQEPSTQDIQLAKQYGIVIWGTKDIDALIRYLSSGDTNAIKSRIYGDLKEIHVQTMKNIEKIPVRTELAEEFRYSFSELVLSGFGPTEAEEILAYKLMNKFVEAAASGDISETEYALVKNAIEGASKFKKATEKWKYIRETTTMCDYCKRIVENIENSLASAISFFEVDNKSTFRIRILEYGLQLIPDSSEITIICAQNPKKKVLVERYGTNYRIYIPAGIGKEYKTIGDTELNYSIILNTNVTTTKQGEFNYYYVALYDDNKSAADGIERIFTQIFELPDRIDYVIYEWYKTDKSSQAIPRYSEIWRIPQDRTKDVTTKDTTKTARPLGVTFIAGMMILNAIVALLIAVVAGFTGHMGGDTEHPAVFAAILLVFSVVFGATGYGMLQGKRWAWLLSIIFFGVVALGALTQDIVSAVIFALIVYYLTKGDIRVYFS